MMYNAIFLASIGAILCLLGTYWVGISIFQAFQGLFLLGTLAAVSGLRAFSPELSDAAFTKAKTE